MMYGWKLCITQRIETYKCIIYSRCANRSLGFHMSRYVRAHNVAMTRYDMCSMHAYDMNARQSAHVSWTSGALRQLIAKDGAYGMHSYNIQNTTYKLLLPKLSRISSK